MRIDIKQTQDAEFIKEVMASIWDATCEDGAVFETWEPNPSDVWVEIIADGRRIGAYRMHAWNASTVECHAQIFPHERKKFTLEVSNAFRVWLLENSVERIQKYICFIPSKFPNVAKYIIASGWVEEGCLEKTWCKDGILYDMYVMGCTRERMEAWT